jgi:hypothetical protein
MPNESLSDELIRGFGNAVSDIRQKLVEEAMWGRAVTAEPPEINIQWPEAKEQAAPEVQAPEQSQEKQAPDLER